MQNSIFVVNKEPYCIWEMDVLKRNKEFLTGIDTEYFDYLAEIHLRADDKDRAALALRATYHHALETLFSLIGAYVQAPDCAYAWVAKCSNSQLRNFVAEVNCNRNLLFTKFCIDNVTWHEISKIVFAGYLPNTEKNETTVNLFAVLWEKLAREFLNDAHIDEYNSIKHGFRVRAGGFSLAIGREHEYGVSPPQDEMKILGHSAYGTTIIKLEQISSNKGERSYRSMRHSLNWSIEKTVLLLQLASISINNVTSALKIYNEIEASTCKFVRPLEDEEFEAPWLYSTGVTSSTLDYDFQFDKSMKTSKEQLQKEVDNYAQSKVNK